MDFFAAQEQALRSSRLMIVGFGFSVAMIIVIFYLSITVGYELYRDGSVFALWNPGLFLVTTVMVGGIILLGTWFKIAVLARGGGAAVAKTLGGRLVPRASTDPQEQRLLNIVDEMAIASGIPVPPVYLLDKESGINAFAAGSQTTMAIIAVTRGALEKLSRDELQGVIAHEFSHVLNGDMRLNLRLIGVLNGILLLYLLGRGIFAFARVTAEALKSFDKGNSFAGVLGIVALLSLLLSLLLMLLGAIGVPFGRLIKAAVSRQREFLADAAAVQFTRNPVGIAGALRRIAKDGSVIKHPKAEEASHLFFGNISKRSYWFATHPPLAERIRRIDAAARLAGNQANPDIDQVVPSSPSDYIVPAMGVSSLATHFALSPAAFTALVGVVQPEHLYYTEQIMASLPGNLVDALRQPVGAQAVMLALLLSTDSTIADSQLREIRAWRREVLEEVLNQIQAVRAAGSSGCMPLLNLALPTLGELDPATRKGFLETVAALIDVDGRISLFEYTLQRLLRHALGSRVAFSSGAAPSLAIQHRSCELLLTLLVYAGSQDPDQCQIVFAQAVRLAPMEEPWTLLSREEVNDSAQEMDRTLEQLAAMPLLFRKRLIEASVAAVLHDGQVTATEGELLRVVCEALDCPVPPLLEARQ